MGSLTAFFRVGELLGSGTAYYALNGCGDGGGFFGHVLFRLLRMPAFLSKSWPVGHSFPPTRIWLVCALVLRVFL